MVSKQHSEDIIYVSRYIFSSFAAGSVSFGHRKKIKSLGFYMIACVVSIEKHDATGFVDKSSFFHMLM